MKAKVLISFYDTAAKKTRNKGEVFDVTAARFNEITRKGRYIEAADDTPTPATEKK